MNNYPVNDHDILQESRTCENIFEILSHLAVFNPLLTCVTPGVAAVDSVELSKIFPNKQSRELYVSLHIEEIVKYFQKKENIKKFAVEVEKFYLEHKKALIRAWINDSHKNSYSIAIATLRAVADMHSNVEKQEKWLIDHEYEINKSSTNLTNVPNINFQVLAKFHEIFNEYKIFDFAWDIEWNLRILNDWSDWSVEVLLNDIEVTKIWGKFVNTDTRSSTWLNI